MTIIFCRVADLLDYTSDEITGMNMYTLCHGEDANRLRKSHVDCKYCGFVECKVDMLFISSPTWRRRLGLPGVTSSLPLPDVPLAPDILSRLTPIKQSSPPLQKVPVG
jgi:hypothetical protein